MQINSFLFGRLQWPYLGKNLNLTIIVLKAAMCHPTIAKSSLVMG